MIKFGFATTRKSQRYCEEIVRAMQTFCELTEGESVTLLNEAFCPDGITDDDDVIYHECPYYYAIGIYCGRRLKKRDWWKDEKLWPPPKGWEGFDSDQ